MSTETDVERLEYIFHPRSIAFIGVSSNPASPVGETLIGPSLELGFDGGLYPVNPKGGEWRGLKIYPSLKEIPGPVDYVISLLSASAAPKLMEECAAKGVKVVHVFSSGFSEVGTEEGKRREAEIVEIARKGGVRILGPNCMGIYCPKTKLSSGVGLPKESGNVGVISQSGANFFYMIRSAGSRGVRFSKVISYGNACDLNETDFLEYFAKDPDTEIIAAYMEGVKKGQKFLKALKAAAEAKPVIIYKAGYTEAGVKTAASHTGSLAGGDATWDAIFKQMGVIRVYSMDELIDVVLAFSFMSPPRGRNVGVFGTSGGASVQIADECERAGLFVPKPPPEVIQKLREFTPEAGNIVGNPLDSEVFTRDIEKFADGGKILGNWKGIDLMLFHLGTGISSNLSYLMYTLEARREAYISCAKECAKPAAMVLHSVVPSLESWKILETWQRRCNETGLPLYPSIGRTANAISKFIKYYEDHMQGK